MDDDPDPEPSNAGRHGASLRVQVVGWLLLINALVFVAGGAWLSSVFNDVQEADSKRLYSDLIYRLRNTIASTEQINVRRILVDPIWNNVADAMIADKSLTLVQTSASESQWIPLGVALNPVGAAGRETRLGSQAIMSGLAKAMESGEPVDVAGGRAIRIETRAGVWGAFWCRMPAGFSGGSHMFGRLFPWFLISTLLLTGGSFMLLSRLALEPLKRLGAGVRRLESGDLSARIEVGSAAPEFRGLMGGFNAMADEVEGFNARLEAEVELATSQARAAEKAALTQRRLAAMGELTAGIAHEINNPLGGLLNAAAALKREDLAPERRVRYTGLLVDGLERIRDTVSGLLRFTPRETAAISMNMVDVLIDSIALVRHRATGLGIGIGLSVAGESRDLEETAQAQVPGAFALVGSRNELGQVVLNLLGNALDALEEARTAAAQVLVSLETDGPGAPLVLTVADNGPGVGPEVLEKVADLFFTTKDVGKGTGLGLGIVHRIVDAHGGTTSITSSVGEGFRVCIELPRGGVS